MSPVALGQGLTREENADLNSLALNLLLLHRDAPHWVRLQKTKMFFLEEIVEDLPWMFSAWSLPLRHLEPGEMIKKKKKKKAQEEQC